MSIPKTFYITLRETPIREQHIEDQLKIHSINAEKFYGINGFKLGLIPKIPDTISNPSAEKYATLGAVGNYLSHINLWNVCLRLPDEEFFILEDDCVFSKDFNIKFEKLYSNLPKDWNMIYVGWVPVGQNSPGEQICNGICKKDVNGTNAYLIKKSAIPTLIETSYPLISTIDVCIRNRAWPLIQTYVFDPSIVNQLSYINNNDPNWFSMIYDWGEDPFNLKLNTLNSFKLEYGWYNLEKLNDDRWRWTSPKFSLILPSNATNLNIFCISPRETEVEFSNGGKQSIKIGNNILNIPTKNIGEIEIIVKDPFIPSENNEESTDNRSLGVMVTRLDLTFNGQDISFLIKNMQFSDV